ncbi:MAG: AraC family transcriptional regulator [Sphaerochaetaceae bacterium]|nr:AraC family transcriptional regulator [Sphaerochaetaceae bacterium]
MKSQKEIDLLCKVTNAYYLKFKSNGMCISDVNYTNIVNLEQDLYYSKQLLFEKLSTDIVIALKEDLFYVLVKDTAIIHLLGPLEIDFKNFDDYTFVSYDEIESVSRLFYYLLTGYELFYHIPRFVDESYKYYKGEKFFFSEEKIFNVEEQPRFTFNNQYQLYNVLSISIKERNKGFLHNYINSLLEEDLFEELEKDYEKQVIEKLGKLRLKKNILIHSLSQIMYYLNEEMINQSENVNITYLIITEIEKANNINSLITIAYKIVDKIIDSIDDYQISHNAYVRKATNFIICNLDQKITLDVVSEHLAISSKYLSTLFKSELNITFKDYVIDKRVRKAKKLLSYTNKSLSDISLEIGIQNSNNFISFFKTNVGTTPNEYRKRTRLF